VAAGVAVAASAVGAFAEHKLAGVPVPQRGVRLQRANAGILLTGVRAFAVQLGGVLPHAVELLRA
jgi:hypothetical protein